MPISRAVLSVFDCSDHICVTLWITRIMQSGFGHVHAVHEARTIETTYSNRSTGSNSTETTIHVFLESRSELDNYLSGDMIATRF